MTYIGYPPPSVLLHADTDSNMTIRHQVTVGYTSSSIQ